MPPRSGVTRPTEGVGVAVMKLKEGTSPLKPAGVCGGVLSFGVQALEVKKNPMNVNPRASSELVTTNQSKGKNRRSVTDFKEAGKIGIKKKVIFLRTSEQ